MRHLVSICLTVLSVLLLMPIIVLSGMTNLGALADSAVSIFDGSPVSNDAYAYGNCTYWVAWRRMQIGQPIPNNWGNAINWAVAAAQAGYLVNHVPDYGAIMQDSNAPGGEGHVAFVEYLNPADGSWTISEMNRVGWDETDTRVMPASAAVKYDFIH